MVYMGFIVAMLVIPALIIGLAFLLYALTGRSSS